MTPEQFKTQIAVMMTYYPGKKMPKETLRAWWMKFRDIDFEIFNRACDRAVNESEFVPTVALINKLMGADYSFEKVYEDLQKIIAIPVGGSFRGSDLHPLTQKTLKSLGGKTAIGMMTHDELMKRSKIEYKYAVGGIEDDRKRITRYSGGTTTLKDSLPKLEK